MFGSTSIRSRFAVGTTVLIILAVLLCIGSFSGCPGPSGEGEGEGEDTWAEDSFKFDVDLAPDVVVVPDDDMALLLDSDLENEIYTFDAAGVDEAGLDLTVGKVLVIPGIAVRRIWSVEEDNGQLVVETDWVPLNEVITDGEIEWDYGVEFTPEKVKSISVEGKEYPVKAGSPIEISFDYGEYSYKITMTLEGNKSTVEIEVSKELATSIAAKFNVTGEIERFRSKNRIVYAGGQLQEFGNNLNQMRGDLTLQLAVQQSGLDMINYKPSVVIMKIPFVVGFIPVELNVKIQFVINASVPTGATSTVKTNFKYDSTLGLSYNGTNVSYGGNIGNITFGKEINQTGAAGVGVSANFGIGFPRVDLSILRDSIVPWAQTAFLIGGSYTFMPACQTADAEFIGSMGYDLSILGLVNLGSGSKTLFQEKKELLRSGDCEKSATVQEILDAADLLAGQTE